MRSTEFLMQVVAAGLALAAVVALVPAHDARAWELPANTPEQQNPLSHEKRVVADGKAIYEANCAVCHGERGRGRGPAAISLNPRPKPFSEPYVAAQPDWALFWKITHGKAPMPAWERMLTDEQRWEVIHYLHTLMGSARAKRGG